MAELINLNRARKAKARDAAKAQAVVNRAKHGRSGAEKAAETLEAARQAQRLDGHRLPDEEG
jgi:nitrous oxide reductase accessory protein NosL